MNRFCKCAKAVTDENRVTMLKLLTEKDICICEMKEIFLLSESQTSRNLRALYDAGFLKRWREGKCVVYIADRVDSDPYCKAMLELVANSFNDNEQINELRGKLYDVVKEKLREKTK